MFRFLLFIAFFPFCLFGQEEPKLWLEVGAKGAITKNIDWGFQVTNRFGSLGDETVFAQASVKFKIKKWLRPSIDYRAINDKDLNGNYSFTNRMNFNVELKHAIKRFEFGGRVRYQYSFRTFASSGGYDPDFDQAIRIKPQVSFDIKNSFITPVSSIEYFYNPNYGPLGQRFSKYRFYVGADLEFDNPHGISLGYIRDQEINLPAPETKNILSISYTYTVGYNKKK
jgi:hypothetical protein